MNKKLILAIELCMMALPMALRSQKVDEVDHMVQQVVSEQGMKHGIFSVCVYNITRNKMVYSYDSERSVIPASVQKLFTTGVGFCRLGSDFRFLTKVGMRGTLDREGVLHGNIYITGGGDPLLGSYRYRQTSPDSLFAGWTMALKKKGVSRVDGRVCYNTSVFDDEPMNTTWQWGDIGNYYGAGVCGLNFHENMYFVYFAAGKKLGYPASVVRTQPKNIDIFGTCEVTTGSENSGDNVTIYGSPFSRERLYIGTVPLGKSSFAVRGAMPNPARNCADLFASYLRTHGISVSSNSMQVLSIPDSMRSVVDYYTSDYYTIAQYTNLTSNNIYAESIFKYLGYMKYGRGSYENGARVLMDFFREKRLDASGVRIQDGSGLSRQNSVTTDFLCRFLSVMSKEKCFKDFNQSLAKVGESGTAKNLLPTLPKNITVRLKTGTLEQVKSYAGYVEAANGDLLAFAIVSNGHECNARTAAEKMGRVLLKIATMY